MNKMWRYVSMCLLVLVSAPAFAALPMGCQRDAEIEMVFIEPFMMKHGGKIPYPVGRFKITNSQRKPLELTGVRKAGDFVIHYPRAALEVQEMSGGWKPAYVQAGDWSLPEDKLTVAPGASREIVATLERDEKSEHLGGPFRLVIYSSPQGCIVSAPFLLGKRQ